MSDTDQTRTCPQTSGKSEIEGLQKFLHQFQTDFNEWAELMPQLKRSVIEIRDLLKEKQTMKSNQNESNNGISTNFRTFLADGARRTNIDHTSTSRGNESDSLSDSTNSEEYVYDSCCEQMAEEGDSHDISGRKTDVLIGHRQKKLLSIGSGRLDEKGGRDETNLAKPSPDFSRYDTEKEGRPGLVNLKQGGPGLVDNKSCHEKLQTEDKNEKKQQEEEERLKKQQEEEERLKKQIEEEERLKKQKEEEERLKKQKEEERLKKQQEEEERLKKQREEEERLKKQKEEEERLKKQEEEERLKKQQEEEERLKKQEEEERLKKQEEEERLKKQQEEEECLKKQQEEEERLKKEKEEAECLKNQKEEERLQAQEEAEEQKKSLEVKGHKKWTKKFKRQKKKEAERQRKEQEEATRVRGEGKKAQLLKNREVPDNPKKRDRESQKEADKAEAEKEPEMFEQEKEPEMFGQQKEPEIFGQQKEPEKARDQKASNVLFHPKDSATQADDETKSLKLSVGCDSKQNLISERLPSDETKAISVSKYQCDIPRRVRKEETIAKRIQTQTFSSAPRRKPEPDTPANDQNSSSKTKPLQTELETREVSIETVTISRTGRRVPSVSEEPCSKAFVSKEFTLLPEKLRVEENEYLLTKAVESTFGSRNDDTTNQAPANLLTMFGDQGRQSGPEKVSEKTNTVTDTEAISEKTNGVTETEKTTEVTNAVTVREEISENINKSTETEKITGKHGYSETVDTSEKTNGSLETVEVLEKTNESSETADTSEEANGSSETVEMVEKTNGSLGTVEISEKTKESSETADTSKKTNSSSERVEISEKANKCTEIGELSEETNAATDSDEIVEKMNGVTKTNESFKNERISEMAIKSTSSKTVLISEEAKMPPEMIEKVVSESTEAPKFTGDTKTLHERRDVPGLTMKSPVENQCRRQSTNTDKTTVTSAKPVIPEDCEKMPNQSESCGKPGEPEDRKSGALVRSEIATQKSNNENKKPSKGKTSPQRAKNEATRLKITPQTKSPKGTNAAMESGPEKAPEMPNGQQTPDNQMVAETIKPFKKENGSNGAGERTRLDKGATERQTKATEAVCDEESTREEMEAVTDTGNSLKEATVSNKTHESFMRESVGPKSTAVKGKSTSVKSSRYSDREKGSDQAKADSKYTNGFERKTTSEDNDRSERKSPKSVIERSVGDSIRDVTREEIVIKSESHVDLKVKSDVKCDTDGFYKPTHKLIDHPPQVQMLSPESEAKITASPEALAETADHFGGTKRCEGEKNKELGEQKALKFTYAEPEARIFNKAVKDIDTASSPPQTFYSANHPNMDSDTPKGVEGPSGSPNITQSSDMTECEKPVKASVSQPKEDCQSKRSADETELKDHEKDSSKTDGSDDSDKHLPEGERTKVKDKNKKWYYRPKKNNGGKYKPRRNNGNCNYEKDEEIRDERSARNDCRQNGGNGRGGHDGKGGKSNSPQGDDVRRRSPTKSNGSNRHIGSPEQSKHSGILKSDEENDKKRHGRREHFRQTESGGLESSMGHKERSKDESVGSRRSENDGKHSSPTTAGGRDETEGNLKPHHTPTNKPHENTDHRNISQDSASGNVQESSSENSSPNQRQHNGNGRVQEGKPKGNGGRWGKKGKHFGASDPSPKESQATSGGPTDMKNKTIKTRHKDDHRIYSGGSKTLGNSKPWHNKASSYTHWREGIPPQFEYNGRYHDNRYYNHPWYHNQYQNFDDGYYSYGNHNHYYKGQRRYSQARHRGNFRNSNRNISPAPREEYNGRKIGDEDKSERSEATTDTTSRTTDYEGAQAVQNAQDGTPKPVMSKSLEEKLRALTENYPVDDHQPSDEPTSTNMASEIPTVEFKATMSSHNTILSDGLPFNRTVFVLYNEGQAFHESEGFFIAPFPGWYSFKFNLETKNSPQQILETGLEVSNLSMGRHFWVCIEKRHGDGKVEGTNENAALLEEGDHVTFKVKHVEGQPPDIACCCYEGKLTALK